MPEPASDDDAFLIRLLARIARGDAQALRALYERTAPKLHGVVLRIQRDRSLAEDVLQDVFLKVWQAAKSYAPEAGRPLPWLCTIARHRAIDSVRRRGEGNRSGEQGFVDAAGREWLERLPDPRGGEAALLDRDALRACLGRLDAVRAECVTLAYCEGWSREELAHRHARPVNTIKTWLHRALATLKACLEEDR